MAEMHPKGALFLRVDVGTAKTDQGVKYELSLINGVAPCVTSTITGRSWSLSWSDIVDQAILAGVDQEDDHG